MSGSISTTKFKACSTLRLKLHPRTILKLFQLQTLILTQKIGKFLRLNLKDSRTYLGLNKP